MPATRSLTLLQDTDLSWHEFGSLGKMQASGFRNGLAQPATGARSGWSPQSEEETMRSEEHLDGSFDDL
jgi:hypothetical protein